MSSACDPLSEASVNWLFGSFGEALEPIVSPPFAAAGLEGLGAWVVGLTVTGLWVPLLEAENKV